MSMSMKIVAGLGSIDEYETYVKAGADELFCGYVPAEWAEKYGILLPLNRREVLSYNVQIGARSELEILKYMVEEYGAPVKLTLNSLFYTPEQYPVIAELITDCMKLGFHTFIIADPALVLYIRQQHIPCQIHISGEMAEVNHLMMQEIQNWDITRFIFHRKNSIADMKSCISYMNQIAPEQSLEYEAFVLNEMCHFTGAFCNSLHCDELTHICHLPYQLGSVGGAEAESKSASDLDSESEHESDCSDACSMEGYVTGETGCGLCALRGLERAGVTHLKLVGRGNYTDYMEQDIRQLRKALDLLEQFPKKDSDAVFQQELKQQLFPTDCSHICYYR